MDGQKSKPLLVAIDPVEYGRLLQTVVTLEGRISSMENTFERKVSAVETNINELLALANKGRGAFWAGMTLASVVSGLVGYAAHLFGSAPPR